MKKTDFSYRDKEIFSLIKKEEQRQKDCLELIPSENYASRAVREAEGSVLMNKYSEGYSGKRYYQGNSIIDEIESLAIDRAKKLFGVPHTNVQPYSGSPANQAVYFALCQPGDIIMGMDLRAGGHLTHGSSPSFSGKLFKAVNYGVDKKGWIDYEEVEKLAKEYHPKLIWTGATAYPRIFDWRKFREIAQSVGAWLVADIAHYAGLIVGGVYPDPVPFVDIITTTTHKTLRGPRGAIIMVTEKGLKKDPELGKKIDRWIFPGLQGGPHDHQTAAIAVCLKEAESKEFKKYAKQVVVNTRILAEELIKQGFNLISGGTDNHLILIDLRPLKISGKDGAVALEKAGIVVNANAVPNDPAPPYRPSGIRLGTPAVTTRGLKEKEMKKTAEWFYLTIANKDNDKKLAEIALEIKNFLKNFPISE